MDRATRLSNTPKTRASTSSAASLRQERETSEIDQRVPDADARQHGQRRDLLWEDADQRDRDAPQGHPDGIPRAQASSADQQRRGERTQHRTRPDGSGEDAHAGFAGLQQIDGDHDGEYGQRASGE